MRLPLAFLSAIGFGACVGHIITPVFPNTNDDLRAAEAIVWHDVFGRDDLPPKVEWKWGSTLNCSGKGWIIQTKWDHDTGTYIGGTNSMCISGLAISGDLVQVAKTFGSNYSSTSLAHELGHALLYREGKSPDPFHKGPMFAPRGLVDQANKHLRGLGM